MDLAKVAGMASEEARQAALRMDQMEQQWLAWGGKRLRGGATLTAAWTAGGDPSSPGGAAHPDGTLPT